MRRVRQPDMKPADVSFFTFGILAVTQLLRGMNDSLMSPFYSKEAVQRGMSITETGVIYSCRYLVIILSSPLFGKNIERIGSRKMFIVSTIVSANGYFIFGILHWIEGKHIFFGLSLAIRTITSLAETALGTAIIPLTIYTAGELSEDIIRIGYCIFLLKAVGCKYLKDDK